MKIKDEKLEIPKLEWLLKVEVIEMKQKQKRSAKFTNKGQDMIVKLVW